MIPDELRARAITAHDLGDTRRAYALWAARRNLLLSLAFIQCTEDGVRAMAEFGPVAGALAMRAMWEASKQAIWSEPPPWVRTPAILHRADARTVSLHAKGGPPVEVEATANPDGSVSFVVPDGVGEP